MAQKTVSLFLIAYGICAAAVFAMEIRRTNAIHAAVPAIFVFGDSIFDVGNNNFLPFTLARVDRPYNGIDFPGGVATGRFCNGYNIVDHLAMKMGSEVSPEAFLSMVNTSTLQDKMSKGVNFASGGSGIKDVTGHSLGGAFSLRTQIENFATVGRNLIQKIGSNRTDILLSKSIFVFSTGNCDFLELKPWDHGLDNSTQNQLFLTDLTAQFKRHLQRLHQLGARKFAIMSVPEIGCCPYERSLNPAVGECFQDLNELAYDFHQATAAMLEELKSEMDGMSYSLGNTREIMLEIVRNQARYGFKDVVSGCCGSGPLNGRSLCEPNCTYCSNRDEYLFWDPYHPTQKAANLVASILFNGSPHFVAPINFQKLAEEEN
ncbi:hypothetical protein ACLOJK_002298 [Asimina triloba]